MSDLLAPSSTVTFTVTKVPSAPARRKTLERLMQMQPHVKKGLKALQGKRRREDNRMTTRAGRPWIDRKKATKLVWLEPGATFTLKVTPQLIPDIRSIERFVSMAAA